MIGYGFLRGWAPINRNLTGFEEYMAIRPSSNAHNLFISIYETPEAGTIGRDRGDEFVSNGTLRDQIERVESLEGQISLHFTSDSIDAGNPLETGYFMNFHVWEVSNATNFTSDNLLESLNTTHAPNLRNLRGFREFAAVKLDELNNTVVHWDVFETREQSLDALDRTIQLFTTLNDTNPRIDLNGPIMFDIRNVVDCPPYPSGYTLASPPGNATNI